MTRNRDQGRKNERGAALITVLLLVAIMSALIAVSVDRLALAMRREGNRALAEEARLDMVAAEAIAADRVTALVDASRNGTTPVGWDRRPVTLPVPGGRVVARIRDGGNCYNVNALTRFNDKGALEAQPIAMAQFAALAEAAGVAPVDAGRAAAAIADWIDGDTVPLPGGAEDEFYATKGYRAANAPMADVGDLTQVADVAPLLPKIGPLLCALPEHVLPSFNINTLRSQEAALLVAIQPEQFSLDKARALLQRRPAGGFARIGDLSGRNSGSGGTEFPIAQLRTASSWFRLELMAELGESRFTETALIDGRIAPARVVRRSLGEGQ